MKYGICKNTNQWILAYSDQKVDEGLIGFCIADVFGEVMTIRGVYDNTESFLYMSKKNPAWGEMTQFLEDNSNEGAILPWVSLPSFDRKKVIEPILKNAGSDKAVVHVPGVNSVFMYRDGELFKLPIIKTATSKNGIFTEEFIKVYSKVDRDMHLFTSDSRSILNKKDIYIPPDYW